MEFKLFWLRKLLLLFLALSFSSSILYCQETKAELEKLLEEGLEDTSTVTALNKLYWYERKVNPEKGKVHLDQALAISQKLDFEKGKAITLKNYGDYYATAGEYDLALVKTVEAKIIFSELKLLTKVSKCYNLMGVIETRKGQYKKALEYYLKSAELSIQNKDSSGVAVAYQNIGGINYHLQQFDKAEEYILKSLKIKELRKDSGSMVPSLNSLSAVYSAKKEHSKALKFQLNTLPIVLRHGDPNELATITNNIGAQYYHLGELDSALQYYTGALNIYKKINDQQGLAVQYINLGGIEVKLKNGKNAISYFDSSRTIAQEIKNDHLLSVAYKGLSDSYRLLNQYEKAIEFLELNHAILDSVAGEKVKVQSLELQEKFESEQKDKEIAILEKKEANSKATAERRKSIIILSTSIFTVGMLLLIFLFQRKRIKEKQNKIELEQKVLRSQMNPHFIFNSLGAIQQMYMSGETDLANQYLGDFGQLLRRILKNSGEDSISLYEEIEMAELYLELEKERNNDFIQYKTEVDSNLDLHGIFVPPLILQPFIENAIWHGILPGKKPGTITLRIKHNENLSKIICEIEDNGVGFKSTTEKTLYHESKGIYITEKRLQSKVHVTTLPKGTLVQFEILI